MNLNEHLNKKKITVVTGRKGNSEDGSTEAGLFHVSARFCTLL